MVFFFKIILSGENEPVLTRTENGYEPIILIKDLLRRLNKKNEPGVFDNDFMEAVRNVTAFEQELLNIKSEFNLKLYNISELSIKYPFLNWNDFFDNLFTEVDLASPINQSTEVSVDVRL